MYKLEIGDLTYELNGKWTVQEWQELKKYDASLDFTWPKLLSTATGAPLELCAKIPDETLQVGVALVSSLLQPSWSSPAKTYRQGKLTEFDKLTIGQFIDCEVAIGRGLETWMHLLVGSLYNAEPEKVKTWEIQKIYPAVHNYLNWRMDLYKKYESLFEFNESDEDGPKTDAGYIWYDMLMVLSDEKFLNIKAAAERPVFEALNYIAWRKDQAKKEELERKKLKV